MSHHKKRELLRLARNGHMRRLRALLDDGVEINFLHGKTGMTPLMTAAYAGYNDAVKLLLHSGALPNLTADDGASALLWASRNGHLEIVNMLLNAGADVNVRREVDGPAPLHFAISHAHDSIAIALMNAGSRGIARCWVVCYEWVGAGFTLGELGILLSYYAEKLMEKIAMDATVAAEMKRHFVTLPEPRTGTPVYPLINVAIIAICAVICGADDFVAIAKWGRAKKKWLAKFLDLSAGIPSHDRFNAILAAIKPEEFERCLLSWITELHEVSDGQIIAIDGKTLRRSYDKASSKSSIHMVSAWATKNHISLGQVVTDEKSNEITAIPKLLEMLDISGALITIDAMGCQKNIADKIVKGGGDYCLAVKKNQRKLYDKIDEHFQNLMEEDFLNEDGTKAKVRRIETDENSHGRDEHRAYYICPVPESIKNLPGWSKLRAIGMSINLTKRDGKEQSSVRYYILSKYYSAKKFSDAVRQHWGIENPFAFRAGNQENWHWQLDVTFREDDCRVRKGHADANFSLLRRTALSMLKNEPSAKVGIKNKRLTAGWDEQYLTKVLFG